MNNDPYHLERFVEAQAPVYEEVLAELRAGRKRSHWIWFIFPQIAGLGRSSTAQFYAIQSLHEAETYLQHPVLGRRIRECTRLVNEVEGCTINAIFGSPDDMKFHSSVTLFMHAGKDNEVFQATLQKYFGGKPDGNTLERI
ncbi:MAG TPA: DUF1810 domain-containing protein [Terriglobales bacterium]|jgi:uncharacterized protein (DUF1810 family)